MCSVSLRGCQLEVERPAECQSLSWERAEEMVWIQCYRPAQPVIPIDSSKPSESTILMVSFVSRGCNWRLHYAPVQDLVLVNVSETGPAASCIIALFLRESRLKARCGLQS